MVTRDRAIQRRNQKISIHTTASVVTRILLVIIRVPEISIHTTASVVTQLLLFSYRLLWFQSTPLHQWWPAEITEENFVLAFQSTPLHQWWQRRARRGKKLINFNPHHCISGDKTYNAGPAPPNYFNPHHCISGDKRLWDHNDEQDEFQSTPLHQWWRGFLDKNAGKFDISIHTTASVVTANLHNFSNTIYHKLTKNCLYFYFNTLFLIKQLNFISDFFIFRCEPPGIFTITWRSHPIIY